MNTQSETNSLLVGIEDPWDKLERLTSEMRKLEWYGPESRIPELREEINLTVQECQAENIAKDSPIYLDHFEEGLDERGTDLDSQRATEKPHKETMG